MAAMIAAAFVFKIKAAWRKQPFSLEAWREYKKEVFSPRVFTDESKCQIVWADPINIEAAYRGYEKSRSVAVPVLMLLGFGLMFFSYHFYEKTQAFLGRANHAAGQVVDLRPSDSNDDSTTYAAVVEYNDSRGENRRFVDSFSSSPPSYSTGEKVAVLYDRENPREAQIDRGRANYWLSILLGFFGLLFASLGVLSGKRRSRFEG